MFTETTAALDPIESATTGCLEARVPRRGRRRLRAPVRLRERGTVSIYRPSPASPPLRVEQATLLRSLALPVGYEKSQALAEYSNAVAAVSALQRRRERFLLSAIRELMYPKLPVPECRGIGFTADLEKKP